MNRTREVLNDQYPTIPDLAWFTDAPLTFVIGSRSTWCAGLTGPRAVRKDRRRQMAMGIELTRSALPGLENKRFGAMANPKCDGRANFRGMWGHVGLRGDTPRAKSRARPPLACRQSVCYILNHMVQYTRTRFDASFGALSDATRRGVLEQLVRADASITDLAEKFHMTLTGMKKHVGVLEQAGLVTTEKVGRVRTCKLGLRRLEEEAAWIERYRQLWDARFDELDKVVEALKRKEKVDGRKKRQ